MSGDNSIPGAVSGWQQKIQALIPNRSMKGLRLLFPPQQATTKVSSSRTSEPVIHGVPFSRGCGRVDALDVNPPAHTWQARQRPVCAGGTPQIQRDLHKKSSTPQYHTLQAPLPPAVRDTTINRHPTRRARTQDETCRGIRQRALLKLPSKVHP